MIYKLFRKTGYFLSVLIYYTLALPLVALAVPWLLFSFIKYRTLADTKPVKWVAGWRWPNYYLKIISKFTGYYP